MDSQSFSYWRRLRKGVYVLYERGLPQGGVMSWDTLPSEEILPMYKGWYAYKGMDSLERRGPYTLLKTAKRWCETHAISLS